MLRAPILTALLVSVLACSPAPSGVAPVTPSPASTPTTIVVVVTAAPAPTTTRPTPVPPAAPPPKIAGPERALRLTSDGVVAPPAFRLAGGSYLFAWEVPRPTDPAGCFFGAMLTSEPSVSPFILQTLGPWTVPPTAGHAGSRRLDGLGAGGYSLRPTGDCPWTITVTPIPGR